MGKRRFEAAKAGAKLNRFCLTLACRSVLAGRPGRRRCQPSEYGGTPH